MRGGGGTVIAGRRGLIARAIREDAVLAERRFEAAHAEVQGQERDYQPRAADQKEESYHGYAPFLSAATRRSR